MRLSGVGNGQAWTVYILVRRTMSVQQFREKVAVMTGRSEEAIVAGYSTELWAEMQWTPLPPPKPPRVATVISAFQLQIEPVY